LHQGREHGREIPTTLGIQDHTSKQQASESIKIEEKEEMTMGSSSDWDACIGWLGADASHGMHVGGYGSHWWDGRLT
jgi:hypothetical protein